jgi:hypothetical protein
MSDLGPLCAAKRTSRSKVAMSESETHFGHGAMIRLSPLCEQKLTSIK